jgi:hypothetical protein
MGGALNHMVVRPLELGDESLEGSLLRFDARKAQCFLEKDREKLLAVVEASFGTFGPFNKIARSFFAEQLESSSKRAFFRKIESSSKRVRAAALSSTAADDVEIVSSVIEQSASSHASVMLPAPSPPPDDFEGVSPPKGRSDQPRDSCRRHRHRYGSR